MKRLLIPCLLIVILTLAGCSQEQQPSRQLTAVVRTPPTDVTSARIKDFGPRQGRSSFRAQPGGLLLVFFGFTACPDICPTSMADIRLALNDLPKKERRKVEPVFVTIDPKRDLPQYLNLYLSKFFGKRYQARWTLNQRQLRQATKAFGVDYRRGVKDKRGNYSMSHTASIFAVNDRGQVVAEWPYPTDGPVIGKDLTLLLSKNANPES